ncbi:TIR domain-containing protein [Sphingomonas sp. PAMC 26605]|uniref:TIR domain-containing protein n=1 Tax=Sphingomonas sp. PAMC 26605 TaxID=1112214 RepID=UPI00026CABFD|nr:TIR domain-containing protein [Sphingomonas sp. PAMC 26605]
MRHRVFISHCAKDADVANDVCRRIERLGVGCWIAPRDIVVGEDYAVRVMDAIEQSTVFAIILSRHTNTSHFVKAEAEQAFNYKIPIFPLRIEDIEFDRGLRLFLSIVHRVDAFGARRGEGLDRFVDAVVAKVAKGKPRAQQHSGTDWAAIARAIGPGAREYITQWKRMDERRTGLVWTWEAFLGGPIWPFYRGMIGLGLVLVAFVAVIIALGAQALASAEGALAGLVASWLLAALITATAGSAVYRRHIDAVLVRGRAPTQAARSLWMSGAAIALVAVLAVAVQRGLPQPQSTAPAEATLAANAVSVVQSGGAKIGYPDPVQAALQHAQDIQNAIEAAQLNAALAADNDTTDTINTDTMSAATATPPGDDASEPSDNAM